MIAPTLTAGDRPDGARRTIVRSALALTGFTAIVVQVLLLRELMVAWRGNEMSFSVALSVWLALTGLGGIAFAALRRRRFTHVSLAGGLLTVGALAPVALMTARFARQALGVHAGEIVGVWPLVVAAAASLAPFTFAAGFLFPMAVSVLSRGRPTPGRAIGEVYILEALGAVAGGLAVSVLLLPRWDPVRIACLATAVDAAAALALAAVGRSTADGPRAPGRLRTACAAALVLAVVLTGPPGALLDGWTVRLQWRELGFRSQTNSIYGRIVTAAEGTQKSVYESGVLVASSPDRLSAEEAVHLPMLEHPSPGRVLLLGGGLGGAVQEILKHPSVEAVDYVELDPELPRAARREFGDDVVPGLDDPRVTLHFADARFFVKRAQGPYDVVVVNVPDPTTAQLNRFYTVEFLREVRAILSPGGVVGLALTSSENYVSAELADVLACVRNTLVEVFPTVAAIPGDPTHLIAGDPGDYVTRDPLVLASRIAERNLDVVYVRDYYLFDRLRQERLELLDESIARSSAPLNSDTVPSGYFLSLIAWNRQLGGVAGILSAAPRYVTLPHFVLAAVVLGLLLAGPALSARRAVHALRRNVLAAIVVVGATEISIEIAALLAFQSLYGYVYYRMAIIVAAFMGGLAVGGWFGMRAARAGAGGRSFALLQLGITLVPVLLGATIVAIAGLPPDELETWAIYFPVIVVASAVLAGMQFPLAGKLYLRRGQEPGAIGGRLYGADLLGSAVGATAVGVLVLPILGILGTMLALFALNAAVTIGLVVPLAVLRRAGPPARRSR